VKNLSVQALDHPPAEPPGGFLKMQPALLLPERLARTSLFVADANAWRISGYGLEGSSSFTAKHHIIGRKGSVRYSNEICLPWSISILRSAARYTFTSRTYEPIWMPYAPAFMRNAPPTVPRNADQPFHAAQIVFRTERHRAAKVGRASTLATFSFQNDFWLTLNHCRTTNGNSIHHQQIRSTSKEFVRQPCAREVSAIPE